MGRAWLRYGLRWWLFDVNEKGKAEAKRAGELMKEAGLDFDVCYTSYLKHAINTQQIALKVMERVSIAAHGNSLRSLIKYFENISNEDIINVEIPTGTPLVYEFDDDFKVTNKYYLK